MKITRKMITDWRAYEVVRQSGEFNMITQQYSAAEAAGLTDEEYRFCLKNYSELKLNSESNVLGKPEGLGGGGD